MDSLLNPKETPAQISAKENIQLSIFDSVHNKIMYFMNTNQPVSNKDIDIIKEEIKLYKSITNDTSNILDIKLSRLSARISTISI